MKSVVDDITAELLAEMMRNGSCQMTGRDMTSFHVTNNHHHHHHHHHRIVTEVDSNNNNNHYGDEDPHHAKAPSVLIIIDARPFQAADPAALMDLEETSGTSTRPLARDSRAGGSRNVSIDGSVRVHYPNLIRRRSKGKMSMEHVLADPVLRSYVNNADSATSPSANPQSSSLPRLPVDSCSLPPSSPSSSALPPISPSSSSPSSSMPLRPANPFPPPQQQPAPSSISLPYHPTLASLLSSRKEVSPALRIVVYDQDTPCVAGLSETSDAKLALDVLREHSFSGRAQILFLAGGIDRFCSLYPDLCTTLGKEATAKKQTIKRGHASGCYTTSPLKSAEVLSSRVADGNFEDMEGKYGDGDQPAQLLPWLFIGNQSHASNRSNIDRLGITALLNVAALSFHCQPTLPLRSAPVLGLQEQIPWRAFTPELEVKNGSRFRKMAGAGDEVAINIDKVPYHRESLVVPPFFKFPADENQAKDVKNGLQVPENMPCQSAGLGQGQGHVNFFGKSERSNKIQVVNLPIADDHVTEISAWFDLCNSFIDKIKSKNGKVLVHCQAGISRSATICLAYLLWSETFETLNDAFEFVRGKRSVVAPNFNFLRQLEEYETVLIDSRAKRQRSIPETIPVVPPSRCSSATPKSSKSNKNKYLNGKSHKSGNHSCGQETQKSSFVFGFERALDFSSNKIAYKNSDLDSAAVLKVSAVDGSGPGGSVIKSELPINPVDIFITNSSPKEDFVSYRHQELPAASGSSFDLSSSAFDYDRNNIFCNRPVRERLLRDSIRNCDTLVENVVAVGFNNCSRRLEQIKSEKDLSQSRTKLVFIRAKRLGSLKLCESEFRRENRRMNESKMNEFVKHRSKDMPMPHGISRIQSLHFNEKSGPAGRFRGDLPGHVKLGKSQKAINNSTAIADLRQHKWKLYRLVCTAYVKKNHFRECQQEEGLVLSRKTKQLSSFGKKVVLVVQGSSSSLCPKVRRLDHSRLVSCERQFVRLPCANNRFDGLKHRRHHCRNPHCHPHRDCCHRLCDCYHNYCHDECSKCSRKAGRSSHLSHPDRHQLSDIDITRGKMDEMLAAMAVSVLIVLTVLHLLY